MVLTKIPGELIADNSIATADLADGAVTTAKIADGNVTSAKLEDDIVLPGNGAFTMPAGTTLERPGSPTVGMERYNTDLARYEWYDRAQ